jgi:orotidine-5'-phosphate decarboxylase
MATPNQLRGADRLIVALDVPSVDAALRVVHELDNVSFFKIGLQLFLTGGFQELLTALRGKRVFVDLKVPGDISNTIAAVVDMCVQHEVAFLTLSESMPSKAIRVAADTRNARARTEPKFLIVPLVSSLDADDVTEAIGGDDLETYVLKRAKRALDAGCDGIIASGDAIGWCRAAFPSPVVIVSPGKTRA